MGTNKAIEECKRAVERDPGNEEALFYLGLLLQKSGSSVEAKVSAGCLCMSDTAQEAYRKCLALNPGREDAWIQQASVFLSLGDIPAALRSYLSVLERNASSSLAHAGIGRILEQGGKTEAAIVSYQKALRAGGGDKSVFTLLYNLYFRSRRFEAARDVAQKFQETCADDEDASTKLGKPELEGEKGERGRKEERGRDRDRERRGEDDTNGYCEVDRDCTCVKSDRLCSAGARADG
eukprot:755686-Hanusia_phi.AAC.2